MFIKRHLEKVIKNTAKSFPVVLLTGARQVGKSTLLQHCFPQVKYYTMDDSMILNAIKSDARGFLCEQGTPLILDEIQQVGESFIEFKIIVDEQRKGGMYFLTGSQKFVLMQNVSDSLAGRIGILELTGLSNRELAADSFNQPFLPTKEYLQNRQTKIKMSSLDIWKRIHGGQFPEICCNKDISWEMFYANYLRTYLERDVRQLSQVGDLRVFEKFMVILAARIGGLLNVAEAAREAEIDVKTAKRWLSILEASNAIFLLQPFSFNVSKRVIKAPKIYFYDTGLVCYLTKWFDAATAMNGALAGALFENFAIMEIAKSYWNAGREAPIYYFREPGGREIDLLFYQNNTLYPLEIKKTASPNSKDMRHFDVLPEFFPTAEIGEGGVLCMYDKYLPFGGGRWIIPLNCV